MIKVDYSKSIQNTEAFALIVEGWNELVQDGHSPERISLPSTSEGTEVLYVKHDGELVGCLLWNHLTDTETFDVIMAYVEITLRKRGMFKEMMANLRKLARQRGVSRITMPITLNNSAASQAARSVGAAPSTVVYELRLVHER